MKRVVLTIGSLGLLCLSCSAPVDESIQPGPGVKTIQITPATKTIPVNAWLEMTADAQFGPVQWGADSSDTSLSVNGSTLRFLAKKPGQYQVTATSTQIKASGKALITAVEPKTSALKPMTIGCDTQAKSSVITCSGSDMRDAEPGYFIPSTGVNVVRTAFNTDNGSCTTEFANYMDDGLGGKVPKSVVLKFAMTAKDLNQNASISCTMTVQQVELIK